VNVTANLANPLHNDDLLKYFISFEFPASFRAFVSTRIQVINRMPGGETRKFDFFKKFLKLFF